MEGEICYLEMIINSSEMFWDRRKKNKRKYSGIMLKKEAKILMVTEYIDVRQNILSIDNMFMALK